MAITYFIFFSGALLELLSQMSLWGVTAQVLLSLKIILGCHIIANILMTYALCEMLPDKYNTRYCWIFSYFFLLGFFIPFLGNIGILFILFLDSKNEYINIEKEQIWQITTLPHMPDRPPILDKKITISAHGMPNRLKNMQNPNEHLNIVLATRFMKDKNAILLLTTAMRNPEDDIRLLAFSLLEKRGVETNAQIEILKRRLEKGESKTNIHKLIGQKYLTLATQGLIQDEMKTQILKAADEHLNRALDETPSDNKAHFILGQVLLENKKIEQAEQAFKTALKLGFPSGEIYPLLAEIAFHRRRFREIPSYLKEVPAPQRSYSPIAELITYWV